MTEVPAVQPLYFAVSPKKLLVMGFCTLSLYEFYWFYRNWAIIKQRENSAISPFWRTFFAYLYCFPLFSHIRDTATRNSINVTLPAGPLATAWIVLNLALELPDPYGLLGFLAVFLLLPVQIAATAINTQLAPGHERNERFTNGNIVAAVIGSLLVAVAVYGTFFPLR